MNLQTVNKDIKDLERALKIVEKTENYLHFNKSAIMMELCEQINVLRDKRDRQEQVVRELNG